ncbi:hypothetical protein G9A89_000891 [Geosiphon pyriformis]|nr:hypothetical protein G9A89_000891 [Geosiphon pyriformis]
MEDQSHPEGISTFFSKYSNRLSETPVQRHCISAFLPAIKIRESSCLLRYHYLLDQNHVEASLKPSCDQHT